jgi:hypothetical protein
VLEATSTYVSRLSQTQHISGVEGDEGDEAAAVAAGAMSLAMAGRVPPSCNPSPDLARAAVQCTVCSHHTHTILAHHSHTPFSHTILTHHTSYPIHHTSQTHTPYSTPRLTRLPSSTHPTPCPG